MILQQLHKLTPSQMTSPRVQMPRSDNVSHYHTGLSITVRFIGLTCMSLLLLATSSEAFLDAQLCNWDDYDKCRRPIDLDKTPIIILDTCGRCGGFWSSVAGLTNCCLCSQYVFDYCFYAVYGTNFPEPEVKRRVYVPSSTGYQQYYDIR